MTNVTKISITVVATLIASILLPASFYVLGIGLMCHGDALLVPEVLVFPYAAIVGAFPVPYQWNSFVSVEPELLMVFVQMPVYGFICGRAWVKETSFPALLLLCAHVFAILAATIVRNV